jgi:hypothetical protein
MRLVVELKTKHKKLHFFKKVKARDVKKIKPFLA